MNGFEPTFDPATDQPIFRSFKTENHLFAITQMTSIGTTASRLVLRRLAMKLCRGCLQRLARGRGQFSSRWMRHCQLHRLLGRYGLDTLESEWIIMSSP